MSVIHGEGKPRLSISTSAIHTNTVHASSISATTVKLGTSADLDALETSHILKNRIISTLNSSSEVTDGRVSSFDNSTDILTVEDGWSNGNPASGAALSIGSFRIDLPYCQHLIESWTPDFLTNKLQNGNISIRKRGFYYSAVLDYAQFADGSLVEDFAALFKSQYKDFTFYPRRDNLAISYTVDLSPDTVFQLQQARGHRFHKLMRIDLVGTRRLSDVNLKVPAGDGYGFDYGSNYGDSL